jgi:photosystem II stability/assembly factor-like uncharacterized protein
VQVSHDDGESWQEGYQYCSSLTVDLAFPSTVFCPLDDRLFRSTDGGHTWTLLPGFHDGLLTVTIDHPNGGVRVIAGGQGLEFSSDNGASWSARNGGLGAARSDIGIDPSGSGRFYLATYYGRWDGTCTLYRSLDGGLNWSRIIKGEWYSSCGPTIGAEGELYASQAGSMLKSTDGGTRWIPIRSPAAETLWLGANPYTPGLIYAASDSPNSFSDLSSFSVDGGATWETSQTPDCLWDVHYFFTEASNSFDYLIACAYTIFRSTDEGRSWEPCASYRVSATNTGLAVDPSNNNHLLGASLGNGLQVSRDACSSWQPSSRGMEARFITSVIFDPRNPEIAYVGSQSGAYVSFNSGRYWQEINDGLLGATVIYSLAADAQGRIYAATPYGIFSLEGE